MKFIQSLIQNIRLFFQSPKNKTYTTIVIILFVVVVYFLIAAPHNSDPVIIHVSPGSSLKTITTNLEKQNVVRSKLVLQTMILIMVPDKNIASGDYYFNNDPVWRVAYNLARGIHSITPIKVTFPEGSTNEEFAAILAAKIPNFNTKVFLATVANKQGYLFPDTYFFYPQTTISEIVTTMNTNFNHQIDVFSAALDASGKKRADVIVMASILEKEAKGNTDAFIISGILWKRLNKKMPLQVDAAPITYKNKGLPAVPISNPGNDSIRAALYPKESEYFYYLHDKNGQVHYAVTFAEHRRNITTYLK